MALVRVGDSRQWRSPDNLLGRESFSEKRLDIACSETKLIDYGSTPAGTFLSTPLELLRNLDLGNSVAEFDQRLSHYFVRTQLFLDVSSDRYDIVKGAKGAGKSAIYRALREPTQPTLDPQNTYVVPAFNESGAPIFKQIIEIEKNNESAFLGMWKVYIFVIASNFLCDKYKSEAQASLAEVISVLELNQLRSPEGSIANVWQRVRDFVKKAQFRYKKMGLDVKVEFGSTNKGIQEVEEKIESMLLLIDRFLNEKKKRMWILFDRLDESFASHPDVEVPALRGLCRAYLDLQSLSQIKLKLFFRHDLFRKIAQGGFVNLTHLEAKSVSIEWTPEDLHSLLCARLRQNDRLMSQLGVDKRTSDDTLFRKIFSEQVDAGDRRPTTWNWILTRIEDGNGIRAPRNLIDLINLAKEAQIAKDQRAVKQVKRRVMLLEPDSLKLALDRLSDKRVNDTLIAEMGDIAKVIARLRHGKAEHNVKSLAALLGVRGAELDKVIATLKEGGVLAQTGDTLKIPMLYRAGLNITQGKAFG